MNLPTRFPTTNPFTFLRQVRTELTKVDWPGRRETVRLTVLVVVASVGVGLYIGGLDYLFTLLLKNLVQ